jgi:cysteine desulfurase family protein (TIGR01976 family)
MGGGPNLMRPTTISKPISAADLVMDTKEIRSHFPALMRRHPHKTGEPVAYLDGPGGTQVPEVVVQRMSEYLTQHNANTHWKYPTSVETDACIWKAREAMADFFNGAPDEIAFGANMTTLTFHVARGLGRGWGPGDEVVITELDHHGNVAPWRALERERGITIKVARMKTEDGTLDMADLEQKITAKTKLVAIGAASNALGTKPDVRKVAQMARAKGALVYVDAVHYAPHTLVDAQWLDADFIACSAYKFYGPHIGAIWGRKALLEKLDVPKLEPAPEESPERLETGTQNHEGIVGAGAAVDFLAGLAGDPDLPRREALARSFATLHARASDLFEVLWNGLGEIKKVKRFGLPPHQARTPTVSFVVAGMKSDDVAIALAEKALFVSNGDFYAATVVDRLGHAADGVVRVGCSIYTTIEEIERTLSALRAIAR